MGQLTFVMLWKLCESDGRLLDFFLLLRAALMWSRFKQRKNFSKLKNLTNRPARHPILAARLARAIWNRLANLREKIIEIFLKNAKLFKNANVKKINCFKKWQMF